MRDTLPASPQAPERLAAPARILIAGSGSAVPEHVIANETLSRLVTRDHPGKNGAWAFEKLGILERRFLSPLDPETGRPQAVAEELDLAQAAGERAVASAGLAPSDIDCLFVVSCTQNERQRHFSKLALTLHRRLGLRPRTLAYEMDAGCGGALHLMELARAWLLGSEHTTALIVASNCPSQYYANWDAYTRGGAWLSMYIFGDGAGALLLRKAQAPERSGILAAYSGVDPGQPLMSYGSVAPDPTPVYLINGRAVAASFGTYAASALEGLREKHPFELRDIRRFYFHQVNGRVLRAFTDRMGIPQEHVATHVERYGNLAAAATLVLLDEDRKAGLVAPGDLCVLCAVGAGAQYGALLVRL